MPGSRFRLPVGATRRVLLLLLAALFIACDDELPDDSCTLGESRCNAQQLETCNAQGTWQSRFVLGQCGTVCTPGESRCNTQQFQTCNAQGTWEGRFLTGQCGFM